jgi:predicted lactoylglutathione lyase
MEQRLSLVTLGVSDLARSRAFYEQLGWSSNTPVELDVAFFQLGGMVLSLWDRTSLAEDSGVALGSGFGAVALAYNVRSEAEVDAAIAEADAAGATISRAQSATFWGGYSGVFLDLDGHPWEVAHNPRWELAADGSVTLPA